MGLSTFTEIEKYFNKNSNTILFPILADHYLDKEDLDKAKDICDIGLGHYPDSIEGKFILAKINYRENNYKTTEKLLKEILELDLRHYTATLLLAKTQSKLDRSNNILSKIWQKVSKIDPTNEAATEFFQKGDAAVTEQIIDDGSIESSAAIINKTKNLVEEAQMLNISPRMATFTMVRVFKDQKLYQQALKTLDILEEKGGDSSQISRERKNLEKLIKVNK